MGLHQRSVRVNRRLLDYNPETQGAEGDLLLFGVPVHCPPTRSPSELEELELANTFLDAANTNEIAAVVDKLLRRGAMIAGKPIDPQVAQLLGPHLTRAGQSVRTLLTPPAGRSDPSEIMERITGAELEGLSSEDQEFETARAFVRFVMEAGRTAAKAAATQSPAAVAAAAARIAARRHAPGLALAQPPPTFRARRAIRRQSLV
jgi:hypothetical protein